MDEITIGFTKYQNQSWITSETIKTNFQMVLEQVPDWKLVKNDLKTAQGFEDSPSPIQSLRKNNYKVIKVFPDEVLGNI